MENKAIKGKEVEQIKEIEEIEESNHIKYKIVITHNERLCNAILVTVSVIFIAIIFCVLYEIATGTAT